MIDSIRMLKEYEESLKGKTLEELEKIESELIAEADANDQKVSKTEFDLPKENYKEVAEGIRMLLNKQTVQWQYTLGLVGLYDFWNPEKKSKKIPYAQLDAILRTLGQMQFTGYAEWYNDCCSTLSVEVINKSFEAALSGKHYYDAADFIKDWDKEMVEYVLTDKDDFAIINDKFDYRNFLYKYDVIIQIPSGYFMSELDLWTDYKTVEENAAELLEDTVMIDFYENDDGDYVDDEGNIIDVEETAKAYAAAFLSGVDFKDYIIIRGE